MKAEWSPPVSPSYTEAKVERDQCRLNPDITRCAHKMNSLPFTTNKQSVQNETQFPVREFKKKNHPKQEFTESISHC